MEWKGLDKDKDIYSSAFCLEELKKIAKNFCKIVRFPVMFRTVKLMKTKQSIIMCIPHVLQSVMAIRWTGYVAN
jgi:hypothetical protein